MGDGRGEVADFAELAFVAEDEVAGLEAGDGVLATVEHLDVDADEGNVALEGNDFVLRKERGGEERCGEPASHDT